MDRLGSVHASVEQLASEFACAFDVSTRGLVLTNRAGAVVAANFMARDLIDAGVDIGEQTCCDLFGCRGPDGPLDDVCVTKQTLLEGRLHNLAVRLPVGSGARAALVTSSPVNDGHVLFELQAVDARSGPGPQTPAPGLLAALTLGRTRLEDERGSVGGEWLEHRPGELLKLLITERHRVVPVDEIAEALWSTVTLPSQGNVRQCVYALRGRLDPHRRRRAGGSVIIAHRRGYSIDRRRLRVDCDEFESQLSRGMAAYRAGDAELARERLTAGLALYRGEFLADEPYASWAFAERARLAGIAGKGLRVLAGIAARRHAYEEAAGHLERLAAMDEYDVDVQRGLIALCLSRGRRSEAKRRYTVLRSRLREDFGEEPGFDLADAGLLHRQLGELLSV